MKIYESKLAQLPGHILWAFGLYTIIAIIMEILFHLMSHAENATPATFAIIIFMWLGQSWRFKKMHYKIIDDTLVQYDFQYRTILINQIVTVRVLDKMKWVSIHTPYNIVIETMDNQKYYLAPENAKLLTEYLKKENAEIQFTKG